MFPLFYFHLATLTYSNKSYGLLITFYLIMLDPPRMLLLLSTWYFLLDGFRGSSWDIFTKGTLFSLHSFMVKSWGGGGGWWPPRLYCHLLGLGVFSISHSHFPFPVPVQVPVAWQLTSIQSNDSDGDGIGQWSRGIENQRWLAEPARKSPVSESLSLPKGGRDAGAAG